MDRNFTQVLDSHKYFRLHLNKMGKVASPGYTFLEFPIMLIVFFPKVKKNTKPGREALMADIEAFPQTVQK